MKFAGRFHSTSTALRQRPTPLGLVFAMLPALAAAPALAAPQVEQTIVAVADIHGAYEDFAAILRELDLIDDELHWIGGNTILVQTGDILDRGWGARETMDLLMRLQGEARAQAGEVVVLLGNHEAMNLVGFLRDTTPAAPQAFIDDGSPRRTQQAWDEWTRTQRGLAAAAGEPPTPFDYRDWALAHPPGYVERMDALAADGKYGRWLRGLPVAHRIGDVLFMHAGLNPVYADLGVDEMNERVAAEMARFDEVKRTMVEAELITRYADLRDMIDAADTKLGLMLDELEATGRQPDAAGQRLARALEWVVHFNEWQMLDGEGLLWFRGLASWREDEYGEVVRELLRKQEIKHIVVGHTVQADGNIRMRFDGGVFLADTGMLSPIYRGRPSALEIDRGVFTARYIGASEVLLETQGSDATSMAPPGATARHGSGGAPPASDATLMSAPDAAAPVAYQPQTSNVWIGSDGSPLPFVSYAEIDEFLKHAEIVGMEEVGTGKTRPLRLELERDGVRARGIFHDIDLYREQKRLGGRFFGVFRDSWRSQIAAYQIARLLQLDNIAPTVERVVDGQRGSLQLWLENPGLRTNGTRVRAGDYPQDVDAWLHQEWTMRVFDALIFNDDRHAENILVDDNWKLWMVDHTRAFQDPAEIREPHLLTHIDRTLLAALERLQREDIEEFVGHYLDSRQLNGLLQRRDAILEHFRRRVEEHGEANVLYGSDTSAPPAATLLPARVTSAKVSS